MVKHVLKAIAAAIIPIGEVLYEVATDALQDYRRQRRLEDDASDPRVLALLSAAESRRQAGAVAREVAGGLSEPDRRALSAYLTQIPGAGRLPAPVRRLLTDEQRQHSARRCRRPSRSQV
jgi:hypothetical protein